MELIHKAQDENNVKFEIMLSSISNYPECNITIEKHKSNSISSDVIRILNESTHTSSTKKKKCKF